MSAARLKGHFADCFRWGAKKRGEFAMDHKDILALFGQQHPHGGMAPVGDGHEVNKDEIAYEGDDKLLPSQGNAFSRHLELRVQVNHGLAVTFFGDEGFYASNDLRIFQAH